MQLPTYKTLYKILQKTEIILNTEIPKEISHYQAKLLSYLRESLEGSLYGAEG
jgi:hypothetical protein